MIESTGDSSNEVPRVLPRGHLSSAASCINNLSMWKLQGHTGWRSLTTKGLGCKIVENHNTAAKRMLSSAASHTYVVE